MKNLVRPIKYLAYCRKSSDSEDRQVQSIEAQKRELLEYAEKQKLNVIGVFEESQSAHHPGRPIFNEVVNRIQKGEADGLLVWHANRISRNPVDSGSVIYLLDTEKLKEIQTLSKTYVNSPDDKFFLQLEFSVSKKDSDDKSVSVKRGLRERALKGYPHGVAYIGYLNDKSEEKGNRGWIEDPIRFPIVKQLFERFLTGRYSPAQIHGIAVNEPKLTTPNRSKEGGRPIAYSYVYKMLANPAYAGFFYFQDARYEINKSVKRMITEDEFWHIQKLMGRKGKPRPQKHVSLYNASLFCEDCGSRTVADFKYQLICPSCKHKFSYSNKEECPKCHTDISKMSNPKYLNYVFYYCLNKKKKRTKCSSGGINESLVNRVLIENLKNEVTISKGLAKWCIDNLHLLQDKDVSDAMQRKNGHMDAISEIEKKLVRLLDLRLSREKVSEDEDAMFDAKEKQLRDELLTLKMWPTNNGEKWLGELKSSLNLMSEIIDVIENGSLSEKKDILHDIRSNLIFARKKVIVRHTESVSLLVKCFKGMDAKMRAFEPRKYGSNKGENDPFGVVSPALLRKLDRVRTHKRDCKDIQNSKM